MSKASPSVENLADDDPDAFPRAFGSYLLLQRFARGGMGEVYLGKFGAIAGLERYCVIKKLRAELTRDREYVTRFIDEARVVVTLNHANICHVFDVGRVGDEYYLAMEYISGRDIRTLQDRCRQRERILPPATALHLVCEVLEALDYAHRRNHPITGEPLNLVHRDVSPQNVLVSYEGEVKLIDFGLAASKLKVERTQPNVVMGKMAYMAPEQARGDPIDARADLFACGVLAYELLAGERFYEGMSANDIWQVAGRGSFVPPKWQGLDHDVAKIIAKALHPEPKKRFATCGDFREALASHLHWRFPGTGVRGVRDVVNELFGDEIRKERELLARYGRVTVASFRTNFESTQSQSVSLARATDEASTAHQSTRLMRDEQSSSTPGGAMPPPGSRDLHQDPTRLTTDSKKLMAPERTAAAARAERSTDEQSASARASRSGPVTATTGEVDAVRAARAPVEHTERVARPHASGKSKSRPAVKALELDDVEALALPRRRAPALVAAGIGAVVIAAVVLVMSLDRQASAPDDVVDGAADAHEAALTQPAPPAPAALALAPTPVEASAPSPSALDAGVAPAAAPATSEPATSEPATSEPAAPEGTAAAAVGEAFEPASQAAPSARKGSDRGATRARAPEHARVQPSKPAAESTKAEEPKPKVAAATEQKAAEPPKLRTLADVAASCARCDREYREWSRNGTLATKTALGTCINRANCK
ncbi:MAG: protein kinase [Deltaproteobacteria bacterium]|nr:protein kinase [Deltaproteobacteria bacterium]